MRTTYQILKQYFGYDSFREGQEQLIESILNGQDVLGIMPTGAGKSLCFQVPSLLMDGITLVVSPLISLMKDQVNALAQAGIKAAFINSSLTEKQNALVLANAKSGMYKLVYIAPERLLSADFLSFAKSVKIAMVTVDEAHCISQWGQDFRPSYTKITEFVKNLTCRPVLSAFTATATERVREDIVASLNLQTPTVLVTGFDRKNLYFEVQKPRDKLASLMKFLQDKPDKSGIVYCATRNAVEEVCQNLIDFGYSASRYHAGLSDRERHDNQDDFLYDRIQIMVATNAFGMGIDKSNVSFVVHYNMPKNIESYYQEAGRSGRDGEPADCLLLYSPKDVHTQLWLIDHGNEPGNSAFEVEEISKERDRRRLREMTFYCATTDCLRAYILKYFGESAPDFCGNCGNCNASFDSVDVTIEAQKILSCVARTNESYGAAMIIDILRGSKSEKVLRAGLEKLSTYNISKKSSKHLLAVINHLVLSEFLIKTDSKFPVLRLGAHAADLLHGGQTIQMKLVSASENDDEQVNSKSEKPKRPVNSELFDILKALRFEIANLQKLPAFVIFPDSALTDMCMKIPADDEEFLQVSGVGKVKLERYGEQFLKAIAPFAKNITPDDAQSEPAEVLDPTAIEITDETVTVTVLADRMNCILMQHGRKKISGRKINDWLIAEGYLRLHTDEHGKNFKVATPQGAELSITSEERNIRGEACILTLFGRRAQELIVSRTDEILKFAE